MAWRAKLPALLFVFSSLVLAFAAGVYAGHYKTAPYDLVRSAWITYEAWSEARARSRSTELPNRPEAPLWGSNSGGPIEFVSANGLADPVLLMADWPHNFATNCTHLISGCMAVEYARAGEHVSPYPYFPDGFAQVPLLVDWPYEHPLGSSFVDYATIESAATYPNRDLLVIFDFEDSHPYAGGLARVDVGGKVLWYRRDYSHHQLHLRRDEVAMVPSLRLVNRSQLPTMWHPPFDEKCPNDFPSDYVHVVDGNGELLTEISVLDVLAASPWSRALRSKVAFPCDPTHLNFVHEVREDAAGSGMWNVEPGDLVLTLRNLSAFAILDGDSHQVKRLHHGTFHMPHSVTHLEGSRFLMFDNLGNEEFSRLLIVDLSTGEETTVFPTDSTPPRFRSIARSRGYLSVSPDRRRAIATYPRQGAVEVRIADGEVLAAFRVRIMASYSNASR